MKKKKSFILCITLFCCLFLSVFFNTTYANETKENDFKIMGTTQTSENNIRLDWTELKNAEYQVYQSIDGNDFQSMSTFDVESGTDKVKVLQVYPHSSAANQLETWLITNGYGKGIMEVNSVFIDTFNANPTTYLKNDDGTWKYDVLFFGTWDSNGSKDLNATSQPIVEQFVKSGKGLILGHDTIYYGSHPYFNKLAPYVNITVTSTYGATQQTGVQIAKKGLFTTYPWNIGEVGTVLTIPKTHPLTQYANGDIWLKFSTGTFTTCNNFYLTTWNNCAMIQTGHSSGAATVDEQKILANLIFYCDQLTNETSFVDNSGQDFALPNTPNIKVDINNNRLILSATDNGTTYQYKAKAYVDGETIESEPISVENKSGIKGYYYIINTNPNEKVMNSNGIFTNGNVDLLTLASEETTYLHIAAVDNANNVSETLTINMDEIIGINASNIIYTINSTDNTTNVDLSIIATGSNINYQWEMKTIGGEWEEISGANDDNYSMDITNYQDSIYYRCRVYNSTLTLYSNEVLVNPLDYDKTFVYVTQASSFSVIIPKTIILDGKSGMGAYEISAKGNVSGSATLDVIPNDFAIMKDVDGVKTSFNASVTQEKTSFDANEIIATTTSVGNIDASKNITAGKWKGTFNFTIKFNDEQSQTNSIGSINQEDDGVNVGYDKEQEQSTGYSHISFVN